jgi:hypothetical protein
MGMGNENERKGDVKTDAARVGRATVKRVPNGEA